jgi:[ribosomal protein S5]-alanine N-acetyltransferase
MARERRPMSAEAGAGVIVETERLVLRRQTAGDIGFLVGLWSDPEVTRHLGGPRDRDALQKSFEQTAADPTADRFDLWPVVEKASGRLVGHCGLLDKDVEGRPEVEVVYVIAESEWRRGYASEAGRALCRHALEIMGLKRVIAMIEPGNEASERTAIAIGMRFQREVARPGGERRRLYAIGAEPPID